MPRGGSDRDGTRRGIRAFLAVEPGEPARSAVVQLIESLRACDPERTVRWIRAESLHMTLHFLGHVAPETIEAVTREVAPRVRRHPAFELHLGALHAFPSQRRPRIVALRLEPEDQLAALSAAVEEGVAAAGLPREERPFRPHLTIGRIQARPDPALADALAAGDVAAADVGRASTVGEVVLFQSELRPGGSRYTPLARLPLGGGSESDKVHPVP